MNSHAPQRGFTALAALFFAVACCCHSACAQIKEPQPQDATQAILSAFDRYEIVGLEAAHGFKELDDYILSLIADPAFPGKVNDIVVECGNRLYQPVLDRYIAGEDVPLAEVQPVWRNTTSLMCSVSGFYENLFPFVRQINQKLPANKRLRVVAADPPLDWNKVKVRADYIAAARQRTSSIASVIVSQVLTRKRKALLLFGWTHLTHNGSHSSVWIYEKTWPGRTLVIYPHSGFGLYNPLDIHNEKLEARMKLWPVPALVMLKGTWLAELDLTYYVEEIPAPLVGFDIADLVDAYLYLGPRDSLQYEAVPSSILDDSAYVAELNRRADRAAEPFTHFNAEHARGTDPHYYFAGTDPRHQTLGHGEHIPESAMPLSRFVGTYSGDGVSVDVDMHQCKMPRPPARPRGNKPDYRLYVRSPIFPREIALLSAGGNRFRSVRSSHVLVIDFEVANGKVSGLTLAQGTGRRNLRLQWRP